jgi:ubiquinone/menaquinone biosynthesis C-methylase UbiE
MSTAAKQQFETVTEQPGQGASRLQLEMMAARYGWAQRHSVGKDVLEVACGTGTGLGALALVARSVEASDIDHSNLRAAQHHYASDNNVHIQYADAGQLPYPDGSFETVLLFEAIYYLPDAARFLAEAKRVLGPGGRLLIATVNREWAGFNPSPFSVRYFSAAELRAELYEAGFHVTMRAGFAEDDSLAARVIRAIRKLAVTLDLVPRTMRGKALLKRMFYGELQPIPGRLDLREFPLPRFEEINAATDLSRFRVLYAEAIR